MDVNPLLPVQKVTLEENTLRFIVPCSISISGPSQSKNCLKNIKGPLAIVQFVIDI